MEIIRIQRKIFSTGDYLTIWRTKAPEFMFEIDNQATFDRQVPKWSPMEYPFRWKRNIED